MCEQHQLSKYISWAGEMTQRHYHGAAQPVFVHRTYRLEGENYFCKLSELQIHVMACTHSHTNKYGHTCISTYTYTAIDILRYVCMSFYFTFSVMYTHTHIHTTLNSVKCTGMHTHTSLQTLQQVQSNKYF